jgi:hypothetical protein
LLVAGRIRDDELSLLAREEAISDIDRDALFALGRKAVDQQCKIDRIALRAVAPAVAFERGELVVKNLPRVEKQPPNQGGLAVVDAAASDETQQRLALLGGEPRMDVGGRVQK